MSVFRATETDKQRQRKRYRQRQRHRGTAQTETDIDKEAKTDRKRDMTSIIQTTFTARKKSILWHLQIIAAAKTKQNKKHARPESHEAYHRNVEDPPMTGDKHLNPVYIAAWFASCFVPYLFLYFQ